MGWTAGLALDGQRGRVEVYVGKAFSHEVFVPESPCFHMD
jgi:hypothetical protein